MKRKWGRKILFVLFGKKKDKPLAFPSFVKKTDEERVENTAVARWRRQGIPAHGEAGRNIEYICDDAHKKLGKSKYEFFRVLQKCTSGG
jgi:hypothetical protein